MALREMNRVATLLAILLFAPLGMLHAAAAPVTSEPPDSSVTAIGTPHFQWPPSGDPMADDLIQIAADEAFTRIVDEDRIPKVIHRYVPDRELPPGEYWWRVAGVTRKLTVRPPERVMEIPPGATFLEIQQTLAKAAAQTPVIVKFARGDYRLDPQGAKAFLAFTSVTDLIIDGNGANLTFTGFLKFAMLQDCQRVMVKNLTFDYDPLPYTAGRVLSVDPKAGTFDVEIEPGHPLPETNSFFQKDKKGMIVDPQHRRMKTGATLVFEHAGWQKLGERRYCFTAAKPKQIGELAPGDVYVLDPRIATGFDVDACNEIVFSNLTVYAMANEGFNSHFGNRLSILHCGIRLKPGRYIASNNGGHNHHSARIGPWIEGCTWENTGDDICHVNSLVLGIEKKLAPNLVQLPLNNPFDAIGASVALDIQPADQLQFFNRSTGRLLSERRVVAVTKSGKSLVVELDGDVGDIVPGRPGEGAITQVFNASRSCNRFVFRNNTVRNGRRVGVLAKGHGGLIENNSFEGLGGGAVEFWNAPFEGLGAVDYIVRGNKIRDCGLIAREDAPIWASMFKRGGDKLHRNLLIADNEITGCSSPAILLGDTENAIVRANRIGTLTDTTGKASPQAILLRNTAGVQLEHNIETEAKQ